LAVKGPKVSFAGNVYLKSLMFNLQGERSLVFVYSPFEFSPHYSGGRQEARRPRNLDSISDRNSRCFSSPKHPDRLWAPLSLVSSGYLKLFPRECGVGA